jgi:MFS family permease
MKNSYLENTSELTAETSLLLTSRNVPKSFVSSQYYPWIIITLCSFFLFYKYILQVSPSVMTQQLMSVFQVHGAGLGNLAAMFFYAYLIAQFFVGPLLDRYSPRYLTAFAIALCGIGTFIFAKTDSLVMAELSRALMGVGTAFATVSYMKMSALWFRSNQVAFVDGLLATSAMLGAMCGQVPLTLLVTKVGWRDSLVYCALAGIVLSIIFILVVKDKNSISLETKSNKDSTTFKWKDFLALFKNKKNWLLTFYSGLAFTPVAVLGGLWGNPFFEEAHHLTHTESATFTSCIFLGLAIGGPLFGYYADCLGDRLKIMMLGTVTSLLALLAAIYLTQLPLFLFGVVLFLFGLGAGAFMLSYPLGKSLNHLGLAATVVALINTGDALFGSLTEPLVGKILDTFWKGQIENGVHYFRVSDYQVALVVLPLYLLMALFCLWLLKKSAVMK